MGTYYKIKTPAPTKKKCLGLGWQSVEEEYDPEAEQCCGEGAWGTPTVCSKDLGCCVNGGTSGTAKCFDQGSQQCCGTWGTPTVCSKDLGCCVSGGLSGTAKCFDQGSQQCCGVVSEMPIVCSLHGGCPSSS